MVCPIGPGRHITASFVNGLVSTRAHVAVDKTALVRIARARFGRRTFGVTFGRSARMALSAMRAGLRDLRYRL